MIRFENKHEIIAIERKFRWNPNYVLHFKKSGVFDSQRYTKNLRLRKMMKLSLFSFKQFEFLLKTINFSISTLFWKGVGVP